MDKLQLISVNVRGLNTDEKRKKLYLWLKHIGSDIILLQETHFVEENEAKYDIGWKRKTFHSYSNSKFSRGVSILFKENLDIEVNNIKRSEDGKKIGLTLHLMGTHSPSLIYTHLTMN